MDEKKYRMNTAQGLFLPADDLDRVLSLKDPVCSLLYLYLLRRGGALDEGEAARTLLLSAADVRAAGDRLRAAGLLHAALPAETRLPAAEELPEYSSEDVARRAREDPSFASLTAEAQSRLGHALSSTDLKKLFGLWDFLGLPCEVIMLIINRVWEQQRQRYGEGRLPTMHAIESEARLWAKKEIFTLDKAEEYLARLEKQATREENLRRLLQIRDRQPTPTERKYMEEWLAMDLTDEAIAVAYDKTVVGTGKLVWKYMDKILRSWQEKGLRTPEDIKKGDAPRGKARPGGNRDSGSSGSGEWAGDDLALAERLLGGKE